ncbi:MAG: TrbI/VirB10 family protein [Acinetobacter sp.]|uniref:TrbI/VirB10 family protein n=1 Tax=Acinetobacter sp. TaxID=472 RepID=UPI002637685D|nr:TrbI/VirB10 family protein [Acinetobacter sp.]MDD2944312.1 TrbI/VirB10 family protein [Acinetobacter sp.]
MKGNNAFKAQMAELKRKWLQIDPTKRNVIIGVVVLAFMVIVAIVIDQKKQKDLEPERQNRLNSQVDRQSVVAPKVGEVGVAELKGLTQSELERQRQQQEALMQNQQDIANDYRQGNQAVGQQISDISKQLASVSDELNAMKLGREGGASNGINLPPLQGIDSTVSTNANANANGPMPEQMPVAPTQPIPSATPDEMISPRETAVDPFRIVRSDKDASKIQSNGYSKGSAPKKNESIQAKLLIQHGMTTGSMMSGILINGMDATAGRGQSNAVPALIRVKTNAILPNRYSQLAKECFVLVSGVGNLASERAEMRGEKIACIFKDGTIIDGPISAFVVGEDGKNGLRGRVVSKQGAAIARSIFAGTIAGLGKQLAPSQVPSLNIGSGDNVKYETPNVGQAGKIAAASGVGNALERVANFYMDLAEQTMPVIEIDAGRRVTIILTNQLAGAK